MHVISKLVPNWTWATFEHQLNPGRCDILSCRDLFGAQTAVVPPNPEANAGYLACLKTQALTAMINAANWDPAFANYCLKGSQIDFIDSTGLAVRLGNSITESGFVQQASCMTCHGRAAFNTAGQATSGAGFDLNGAAPLGPIQPSWYWSYTASPPIFEGMPGLQQIATSADFVWSIPFCAIDDTQNPPAASNCASKLGPADAMAGKIDLGGSARPEPAGAVGLRDEAASGWVLDRRLESDILQEGDDRARTEDLAEAVRRRAAAASRAAAVRDRRAGCR